MPITKESVIRILQAGAYCADEYIRTLTIIGQTLARLKKEEIPLEEALSIIGPLSSDPESFIWRQKAILDEATSYWRVNLRRAERAKQRSAALRTTQPQQHRDSSKLTDQEMQEIADKYNREHPSSYDIRPLDIIKQELQFFLKSSQEFRPFLSSRTHRPFVSERPSDHFGKYVPFYCCSCSPEPIGYTRQELIEHLAQHMLAEAEDRLMQPLVDKLEDLLDEDNLTEEAVGFAPPRPSTQGDEK